MIRDGAEGIGTKLEIIFAFATCVTVFGLVYVRFCDVRTLSSSSFLFR
jgi:hypothetical protein